MKKSLWQQSSTWRWLCILTLLSTAASIISSPWNIQPSVPLKAQYSPSAVVPQTTGIILPQIAPSQFAVPSANIGLQNSTAQVKPSTKPLRDITFDVDFPRPIELFPPNTELHAIGIYEGAPPAGEQNKPWWANCTDSKGQISDPGACHSKYATQNVPREVTIYMNYRSPVVLALMSYNPVIWNIQGETSKLQKVILAGYHSQDIKGINSTIAVDVYTYEASSCQNCRKQPGHFYTYQNEGQEYENTVNQLKNITGLTPVSFQGSRKANSFSLTRSIVDRVGSHYQPANNGEPASGNVVTDHLTIAGRQLPLPAGLWQPIVFTKVPNTNKEDALISLAQVKNDKLVSLYAARVQGIGGNQRIGQNPSCHNAEYFFEKNETDKASGTQRCYWIEQSNAPWQQPLFDLTAAKLKIMGVNIPDIIINIGFFKTDADTSITTYIYVNPEVEGIYTKPSSWSASPWNNNRINEDPQRVSFMKQQEHWADIWFQFFRLD